MQVDNNPFAILTFIADELTEGDARMRALSKQPLRPRPTPSGFLILGEMLNQLATKIALS